LLLCFTFLAVGSETNRRRGSSEDSYDYNGDVEDCVSLLSENGLSVETLSEEPFEEEKANSSLNCEDVSPAKIPEGTLPKIHVDSFDNNSASCVCTTKLATA